MRKDKRPPKHLRTLRHGDVREDGMVFVQYSPTYRNGERWVLPEKFKEMVDAPCKDNRPPVHLRTLRRGDVREDGMIFWAYDACSHKGEHWVTPEKFKAKAQVTIDNQRKYNKHRSSTDATFRIKQSIRTRVRMALSGKSKSKKTLELLGCSVDELRKRLESQFQHGMTWENYGRHGWHIDHIKPCASFDFTLDEDQRKCFHYTNLQPLWAEDNLRKGDKTL